MVLSTTILAGCNIGFGINSRENKRNNLTEFIETMTTDGLNINDNSNNTSTASYSEDLHKSISSEGIDNLDISILASEVTIKSIDGNNITLDCTGTSNIVKETKFNKSRGTIYIEENGINSFNMNGFNNETRKVIIGIPKSFKGNAIIYCGAGTVAINDSSFESLNLKGGMGEATIDLPYDAPFKIITDTGLGDTNISATTSGENTYTFDLNIGIGSLIIK